MVFYLCFPEARGFVTEAMVRSTVMELEYRYVYVGDLCMGASQKTGGRFK